MAEPDDDEGPLIAAIRERRTLEDIKAIVEANRSLVRRRWKHEGRLRGHLALPLHLAIVERLPTDIVRYLLEQWPESVREWTIHSSLGRYSLPAHLACERCKNGDDTKTVHLLLEAWPDSIRQRNLDGNLPVHLTENLKLIKRLVELWPESIRERGFQGMFLLHLAMRHHDPLPTVKFLVETKWPESVRMKDDKGGTPLHCICCYLSPEVIEVILKEGGEDLLLVPDNEGYLPLHRLLDSDEPSRISEDTVRYFVNRSPRSVREKTSSGHYPLHLAMECWFSKRLIRFLVNKWPKAVREKTNDGYLPLHIAAEAGKFQYVKYLVRECPDSVRVKTSNGWLPVHLVLHEGVFWDRDDVEGTVRTARFLVRRYPRSVLEATNEGLLPLHVALRTGYGCRYDAGAEDGPEVDLEVAFIRHLVGLDPASVRAASNELLFPFDYAIRSFYTSIPTLQFVADQCPVVIQHTDSQDRTPLHVAASQESPRPNVVRFVAERQPLLHEARDRNGSLPLHAAVSSLPSRHGLLHFSDRHDPRSYQQRFLPNLQDSMDIVEYLADQRPQSLIEGDHLGNIPLHAALARDLASIDVVKQLVQLRPDSTGIANRNGSLPLHIAVANCQPQVRVSPDSNDSEYKPRPTPAVDIVKFLVEQRPPSVRAKDSKGNIPLVVAASSDADLNVLFYLLKQWPEACGGGGGSSTSSCEATMSGPTPSSRPRKRVKTSSGDGP